MFNRKNMCFNFFKSKLFDFFFFVDNLDFTLFDLFDLVLDFAIFDLVSNFAIKKVSLYVVNTKTQMHSCNW